MNPEPSERHGTTTPAMSFERATSQEWRAIIEHRWGALAREVLDPGPEPALRLRELAREIEFLAVIVAWFRHHGNVTHTAVFLRSNRKSVRERVSLWRRRHPRLVPPAVEPAVPVAPPQLTAPTDEEDAP